MEEKLMFEWSKLMNPDNWNVEDIYEVRSGYSILEPQTTLTCDLKDGEFTNGRRG